MKPDVIRPTIFQATTTDGKRAPMISVDLIAIVTVCDLLASCTEEAGSALDPFNVAYLAVSSRALFFRLFEGGALAADVARRSARSGSQSPLSLYPSFQAASSLVWLILRRFSKPPCARVGLWSTRRRVRFRTRDTMT